MLLAVVAFTTILANPRLVLGHFKAKPVSECDELRQDYKFGDVHGPYGDCEVGREFRFNSYSAALDDIECDRPRSFGGVCWSSRGPPV